MLYLIRMAVPKWWHADAKRAAAFLRRCCALWLVLGFACPSGFAQGNLGDWKNVQNLAPDSGISVKTKAGKKYHGDLVNVTADSLTLYSSERSFPGRIKRRRELRREDIQEVRVLAPTASVLVGGAIGAGIGTGIGAGLEASAKKREGLVTVTLALLGSATGAAIGRDNPIVKGKKIYVSP